MAQSCPLPDELLSHIFSHLCAKPGRWERRKIGCSTLLNACLASKALHNVAREHMYHAVHVNPYDNAARRSLVSALLDPRTARLVRHISMVSWEVSDDAVRQKKRRQRRTSNPSLRAAISGLALSSNTKKLLHESVLKSPQDADVALILCLCQKVQSWEAYCGYDLSNSVVFEVIRDSAHFNALSLGTSSHPLSFQDLRSVKFQHGDPWESDATNLWDTRAVFELPSLDSYRGAQLACEFAAGFPRRMLPSNVKRVHLDRSYLDGDGMKQLLTHCPQLEEFSIHWGPTRKQKSDMFGPPTDVFFYESIGDALRRSAPCLGSLALNVDDVKADDRLWGERDTLGSLQSLTSLRHLRVTFSILFGPWAVSERHPHYLCEHMPFGLETLEIDDVDFKKDFDIPGDEAEDCYEPFNANLMALVRNTRFANLNRVQITGYTGDVGSEIGSLGWKVSDSSDWTFLRRT